MSELVKKWMQIGNKLRLKNTEPGDRIWNVVNVVIARKLLHYIPLVTSIRDDNLEVANEFLKNNTAALTANINAEGDTALHLAVKTKKSNDFIMNLIKLMKSDALLMVDIHGKTALQLSVEKDNIEVVKALIAKQPQLPYVRCKHGNSPLQIAARNGNKGIVSFLLHATKDHIGHSPFRGEDGQLLLNTLVEKKFYGAVEEVLHRHPKLIEDPNFGSINFLNFIGADPSSSFGGCPFSLLQRILYFCVPTACVLIIQSDEKVINNQTKDFEDSEVGNSFTMKVQRVPLDLYLQFWIAVAKQVPYIMGILEMKLMHQEAVKLVKWTCMQFTRVHYDEIKEKFRSPLLSAARLGIGEIVRHILDCFPVLLDDERIEILKYVVENRDTYILELENHLSHFKQTATDYKDSKGNNILHLAAQFESAKRNTANHSAVFQILYELQWFKEMEKLVPLSYRAMKNKKEETPEMVFVETHAKSLSEGKRWLKETANSCIAVAAITLTIAFAAAVFVTVNSMTRDAYIFRRNTITVFCFADGLSIISSTMSLFVCVLILISRYTYRDFHHALPQRLTMGVASLSLSMLSLIVALIAISYGILKILMIAVMIGYLVFVCINLPVALSFGWPLRCA